MRGSNFYTEGNRVYSYGTHVATINYAKKTVERLGWWSQTTSTHINKVANELGYKVVNATKDIGPPENAGKSTLNLAAVFGLMNKLTSNTLEEQNIIDKRILSAVPGISFPENFDSLSEDEKRRRLDAAMQVAKVQD